ncbi:uncharacterized protein LOC144122166 isoform X1 [Amblyomma americanum]
MLRDWASLARAREPCGGGDGRGSLRSSSSLGSLWDHEYGSRLERYRSMDSVPGVVTTPVRRHNPVAHSRSCGALGRRWPVVSHDSLEPAELSLDSVTLDECLLLLREDEDEPRCCKSTQTEAAPQLEPSTQVLLLEIVDLMKMLARGPRFQQRRPTTRERQTRWRYDQEELRFLGGDRSDAAAVTSPPATGGLKTGWTHEADSGIASDSCPSPAPVWQRRKPSDVSWPVQRSRRSELFPADSFRSLPGPDKGPRFQECRAPRTLHAASATGFPDDGT